ncbi:TPA: hypothetical protein KOB80_003206 [Clostridioides difficile]|uniref:hypothetical protein n=1 Tax=Clostridioides difficile TaxID=1496 RepID=UPI00038D867E|nr:hypothetical protein [Clostridioides difficile]EQJ93933.1 hypothetical protein QUE_3392 [Clostridioides difficile P51]MDO0459755.1 hypothetical protein [Clostridioides difficile]SJO78022.1 Uncharacterised protein [Clostridioides difficile]HBF1697472.1 hypothetical protein [Clostridioides difficile]HBF3265492.1 hypothetical protein [Clostridioides difficile]
MSIKNNITKEAKIKKEINRLNRIFKDVDEKKKKSVEGLIQESAFMRITLEELKENINLFGVIDEMQQGEYSILRESPYVKTYNTMIQRYTTLNDKLLALLPKDTPKIIDDGFDDFVSEKQC